MEWGSRFLTPPRAAGRHLGQGQKRPQFLNKALPLPQVGSMVLRGIQPQPGPRRPIRHIAGRLHRIEIALVTIDEKAGPRDRRQHIAVIRRGQARPAVDQGLRIEGTQALAGHLDAVALVLAAV